MIMQDAERSPDTVLETRHLRLVQAIAEAGSVTRAGDRLHLTQSAVSRQLAELEDRLGLQLFARVKKRLVITPAGSHLLDASRRILGELATAERELKVRAGAAARWPLRVSTACHTCYHWLPPALRAFQRRHPDADLRIVLDATPDPVPVLLRGELELAIVHADVRRRELEVEALFDDEVVAVVAPEHRLAARRFLEGADLHDEILLAFGAAGPDAVWFKKRFLGRAVPRELRAVPITEVMMELVKAEAGVAVVHRWIAEPQIRSGAVVACRLTRGGLWKSWKAVYARATPHRAALRDLIALVRGAKIGAGQRRTAAHAGAGSSAAPGRAAIGRGAAAGLAHDATTRAARKS
jgi:LysR family transcriptional regulator for metE and metH